MGKVAVNWEAWRETEQMGILKATVMKVKGDNSLAEQGLEVT